MKHPLRDSSYLLITCDASVQPQSGSSFPCNISPQQENSVPVDTSIKSLTLLISLAALLSTCTSQWQDYVLIQYSANEKNYQILF